MSSTYFIEQIPAGMRFGCRDYHEFNVRARVTDRAFDQLYKYNDVFRTHHFVQLCVKVPLSGRTNKKLKKVRRARTPPQKTKQNKNNWRVTDIRAEWNVIVESPGTRNMPLWSKIFDRVRCDIHGSSAVTKSPCFAFWRTRQWHFFTNLNIYFCSSVKLCMKGASKSICRNFVSEKMSPH